MLNTVMNMKRNFHCFYIRNWSKYKKK